MVVANRKDNIVAAFPSVSGACKILIIGKKTQNKSFIFKYNKDTKTQWVGSFPILCKLKEESNTDR